MSGRKRKKSDEQPGTIRLLDAWRAPANAGGPLGCLATTYTFDAGFFEEQCAGRFLDIECAPEESGAAYLIERETKLRQHYVGVIVDRVHAAEERALSWDVLAARVPSGCMHAKVALLAWANLVRVIVTSANLTEPGYRSNLECAAVLEFQDGSGDARPLFADVVAFLRDLAALTPAGGARQRALGFLDRTARRVASWQEPRKRQGSVENHFVPNGPLGGKVRSALATLRDEVWRGGPPRQAMVLSPFFDREPAPTVAAFEELLAKRGDRSVTLALAAWPRPADAATIVQAPSSLPGAFTADVELSAVDLEQEGEHRALHAKGILLESDRQLCWMLGSSNFTGAGLGVGERVNVEANLAFTCSVDAEDAAAVRAATPPLSEMELDPENLIFQPAFEPGAGGIEEKLAPPVAFVAATWTSEDGGPRVEVEVDEGALPSWWAIGIDGQRRVESEGWRRSRQTPIIIPWDKPRPPSLVEIEWQSRDGQVLRAFLGVNVSSPEALPEPEELRALSLETLMEILSMARPIHDAVARALARSRAAPDTPGLRDLDPHTRVDTSSFLLQRTKRFAQAIEALRHRLEEPCYSRESLHWRLRGPVGPLALVHATEKATADAGELCFLISEVALQLKRTAPRMAPGSLDAKTVRHELRTLIAELRLRVHSPLSRAPTGVRSYVSAAFDEACR